MATDASACLSCVRRCYIACTCHLLNRTWGRECYPHASIPNIDFNVLRGVRLRLPLNNGKRSPHRAWALRDFRSGAVRAATDRVCNGPLIRRARHGRTARKRTEPLSAWLTVGCAQSLNRPLIPASPKRNAGYACCVRRRLTADIRCVRALRHLAVGLNPVVRQRSGGSDNKSGVPG